MAIPSLDNVKFDDIELAVKTKKRPQFSIIYGKGGIGKTTAACYSPDPVILPVGRETGQERMIDNGVPSFENTKGMPPIEFVFGCMQKLLKTEHSRKTLIIDNIGSFREAVEEDVEADNKGVDLKAYGKGAALAYPYYTRLLAGIDAIMKKKDMHVILIAHDVLYNINKEDGTYYQRIGINAPAGENTNVRGLLEARAHNVLYIRGEDPTRTVKGVMGGVKQIATSGKINRVIYTKPQGTFFAKSRVNAEPYYEIEPTETEEDLLNNKTNETLIQLFTDLYK